MKKASSYLTLLLLFSCLWISCERNDPADDNNLPSASAVLQAPGDGTLGFFIISDWGYNGIPGQVAVKNEMEKIGRITRPDFVVSCGDNFHYNGVHSVTDPLWQSNFEDLYTDPSLMVPWYVALGNHDYWFSDPVVQIKYSEVSSRWTMPARYYSFTKEIDIETSVRFIVLETEGLLYDYRNLIDKSDFHKIPQYTWFEEQLSAATEDWVIVVGHYPVFSACPVNKGEYDETIILIEPLLEKYQPDFYFCGHDHVFEHARDANFPTDHFVAGSGGFPSISGFNSRTIFTYPGTGFSYMTLDSEAATLYVISTDDRIHYEYTRAINR